MASFTPRTPAETPQHITASYAPFYNHITIHPEIGRFRRFGAQWAKKLYDDIEELLQKEESVHEALASAGISAGKVTLLEIPRSIAKGNADLYAKWKEYEEALAEYTRNLCLSEQVFRLPSQAPYATRYMSDLKVFDNGRFGPTGEPAATYQGPSQRTDTCAWRAPARGDFFTEKLTYHSLWIEENVIGRFRRMFTVRRSSQQTGPTHIPYQSIVAFMDAIACIFAPILLTSTMFALASIKPLTVRIGVIGVFGLLFSLSVKGISGHPTRGEVFSATAAYFAVASVFVGSTSNSVRSQ